MSDFSKEVTDALSEEGVLAKALPGFYQRQEQITLATLIAKAISEGDDVVAEAATGTGKTFAYLVPALLSGERTIISTGTKHLQDQLFFGDLPHLLQAFSLKKKTAYLKGRANYLCHHRIHLYSSEGHFSSREIHDELHYIKSNLGSLERGDRNELSSLKEDSLVWSYATSTAENCLGGECDYFKDCFLQKARKKALNAELLVINHHLFFADSLLKEDGFSEILPNAKLVVFDEAHQLGEVATNFFGERLSTRGLKLLISDIENEASTLAKDMQGLKDELQRFAAQIEDLQRALPAEGRYFWKVLLREHMVRTSIEALLSSSELLCDELALAKERSQGLQNCYERLTASHAILELFLNPERKGKALWAIVYRNSFVLFCSPIQIAELFPKLLVPGLTNYVFTSATLSVSASLEHFKSGLGLGQSQEAIISSPFNSLENSLLYLPRGLPDVKEKDFISALLRQVKPLFEALNGRSLFLFTSYRAMHLAEEIIEQWQGVKLLVQGARSKTELLADFKEDAERTALLATSSFWEGVDVKGPSLSMVVIDKLPFESPYEPLVAAKINAINEAGGKAFYDYQIPRAIISLKQGVGRLLRDKADTGLVVIGDGRLTGRAYGKRFLESLPPMKKTRCPQTVLEFIDKKCRR